MMIRLDEEEKRIEDEMEQSVPLDAEEREKLDSILDRARKTRAISLRITEFDLNMLKKRAEQEGMPYQTLINTILRWTNGNSIKQSVWPERWKPTTPDRQILK